MYPLDLGQQLFALLLNLKKYKLSQCHIVMNMLYLSWERIAFSKIKNWDIWGMGRHKGSFVVVVVVDISGYY